MRAGRFNTVVQWIIECARGVLKFFVLENVAAIGEPDSDGNSDLERIVYCLRSGLPKSWKVSTHLLDSGVVAQRRTRQYIVGHIRVPGSRSAESLLPKYRELKVDEMLLDLPNDAPARVLSPKQQSNFKEYTRLMRALPEERKRRLVFSRWTATLAILGVRFPRGRCVVCAQVDISCGCCVWEVEVQSPQSPVY